MSPAPIQPCSTEPGLRASFGDCQYGWMDFRLEADGQAVQIWLSEVYDPLPNMIAWLEAIARGEPECRLEIDEEDCESVLLASSLQDGGEAEVRLQIREKYEAADQPVFYCRSSRFRLVHAIYTALHAYAQSDEFDSAHWSSETLGERVPGLYGCTVEEWIEAHLADNRRQIRLALWPLEPFWASNALCRPVLGDLITPAERETLTRFGHRLDRDPYLFQSMEGWEQLDLADRRRALHEELANQVCGGFTAAPIHMLRSAQLEAWTDEQQRHRNGATGEVEPPQATS